MKRLLYFSVVLLFFFKAEAQNVIISDDASHTTPSSSAVLELYSQNRGLLIPRMSTANRTSISSPVAGLMVYDTDEGSYYIYSGSGWQLMQEGFWLYNSSTKTVYLADNNSKVGIGTSTPTGKFEIQADASLSRDAPLFEVKNTKGVTVFAVYNNGVRIYIDTTEAKAGSPGGFAIRGISGSKVIKDYMWVTPDSIRFYIDTTAVTAGSPGGFAIKGISGSAKGLGNEEYLRVTRDSTRVYVNTSTAKAGSPGGFAIKGLSGSKGNNDTRFLHLVPDNYFIGHRSGINITTGKYNTFFGYEAGMNDSTGSNNIFVGYKAGSQTSGSGSNYGQRNIFMGSTAGYSNTMGNDNIMIGDSAGYQTQNGIANILIGNNVASRSPDIGAFNIIIGINSASSPAFSGYANVMIGNDVDYLATNDTNNVFIGDMVASANTTGSNNVFIGAQSGFNNDSASNNIFIGYQSGFSNIAGNYNTFVGYKSGHENVSGENNLFLGYEAGYSDSSGSFNTFIGYKSGHSNKEGDYNLFVGYKSGFNNTDGTNNLFMGTRAGMTNTSGANNTFIGTDAGSQNTIGENNLFIGPSAGYSNIDGAGNCFIGYGAGLSNISGNNNLFIGAETGRSNTKGEQNIFIGDLAGNSNDSGSFNIFIGIEAGAGNISGNANIALGYQSGYDLNGSDNILLGDFAGTSMTNAYNNIIIGSDAGKNLETGIHNIMIGTGTGFNNVTGQNNIFIGYEAGAQEAGSNKLYIDCSNTKTPLIYGDFLDDSLKIYGHFNINGNYTFPTDDGTFAQVLVTDGSGNLSWTDITPESTTAGNGLHLLANEVQLGGTLTDNTTVEQGNYLMAFNINGAGGFDVQNYGLSVLFVNDNAQVGIGTNMPATNTKLHVLLSGTALASQNLGTVACFQQNSANTDWSRVSIIGGNNGASLLDFGDADAQDVGYIRYSHSNNTMYFQTNSSERVTINDNGDLNLISGSNGGELNRKQTGDANLVPIAYGNIDPTGIIKAGTSNISVTYVSTGVYDITINGENYNTYDYVTNVTLFDGSLLTSISANSNNLRISIFDMGGSPVDADFNFFVYKP